MSILRGHETRPIHWLVVVSNASSVPWDFYPFHKLELSLSSLRPPALTVLEAMAYGPIVINICPQQGLRDHRHLIVNTIDSVSTNNAITVIKLFNRLGYIGGM